jgi:hypothetical protein
MIEFILAYFWVLIVPIEIALLFVFYKYYFAEYNAQRWLSKAKDGDWMVSLLSPVIDNIVSDTTDSIIQKMKMELLSGQGQISKQSFSDITTPEEMAMKVSGELIKSTGIKNVPPMLQVKMAQGLGQLVSSFVPEEKQNQVLNTMKTGKELLNQRLF